MECHPWQAGAVHTSPLATGLPFDSTGVFRYLAGHAIAGVESASDTHYARTVRLDQITSVAMTVTPSGSDSVIVETDRVLTAEQGSALETRVRQLFNLDADSATIDSHLMQDPALADRVRAHPGVRLPGSLDPVEQLFRTLVGQQISIPAARTVLGRLSRELCGDSGLFPTARQLADHGKEVLRGPAQRRATIVRVARALANSELVITARSSIDEMTSALTAFSGIGPWTAGYVAMRALGAPDVLLSTDLVLLKGAASLGLPATPRGIAEYGTRWAPYRSYAGLHLWRAAQELR